MTIHDFSKSLDASKKDSKDPIWKQVFELFFPGYEFIQSYDDDMLMQKSGVDDILKWEGKPVWIDRKVRLVRPDGRFFSDIALEFLSDEGNNVPGWICKDTKADYWIYMNRMNKTVQLIPVKSAQAAWQKYKDEWAMLWPWPIKAQNKNKNGSKWMTISRGVPVDVLNKACQEFGESLKILS